MGVLVLGLIWAALLGCDRGKEADRILTDALRSYAPLAARFADTRTVLSELHKGADQLSALPAPVPKVAEWRGKLMALDEVMGVLDAKLTWWLPGELEAARKARAKEVAFKVREEVALATRELEQATKMAVDLTHERSRLERQAALYAPAQQAQADPAQAVGRAP